MCFPLNSFSYAASVNARHCYSSAKLNQGIEDMFLDLTKRMLEKAQQEAELKMASELSGSRRNVVVVEDGEEAQEHSGRSACC